MRCGQHTGERSIEKQRKPAALTTGTRNITYVIISGFEPSLQKEGQKQTEGGRPNRFGT